MMNEQRRELLRASALISLMAATGLISTAQAAEWNKAAFDAKSLTDAMKAMGAGGVEKSSAISLNVPDIAENGAVVPVGVSSTLFNVDHIAILVEKNPYALSADFKLPEGTLPFVTTRVKMGQTSNIHALVKAGGKWFVTSKEVKVTLGGCGG